jgi:gamma-glutamylcyclotransferase (GGCT)/AIG2-like uncharacterized protein YtfP
MDMATPDETTSLFVYGSLIEETHRAEVIGRRVEAIAATLHDYERGRARHYFVRPRAGSSTPGLVLLNLDARDFATLDRYEEIPVLYTREKVVVVTADGDRARCWIYRPTPATLGAGRA